MRLDSSHVGLEPFVPSTLKGCFKICLPKSDAGKKTLTLLDDISGVLKPVGFSHG